jgi:hypothetical protein
MEEEIMIEQVELTLNGRNRVAFKRTLAGALYCELLRPGELRDGCGWLTVDSVFLEPEHAACLHALLQPDKAPVEEEHANAQ